MNKWKERAVSVLFPRRCPVCDEIVFPPEQKICPECIGKLAFIKEPACRKCGKEVVGENTEYCFDCSRHKRSFRYGAALLNYEETARASMVRIKYHNKREYLDFYAEAMAVKMGKKIWFMKADCLVPVPVHQKRHQKRGFNQAEVLAERLAKALYERGQLPYEMPVLKNVLVRTKNTMPQKELSPAERLKNLEQAFAVREIPEGVKSVILVDDIFTTGSTAEACTRALLRAGIEKVYFVCICIGSVG